MADGTKFASDSVALSELQRRYKALLQHAEAMATGLAITNNHTQSCICVDCDDAQRAVSAYRKWLEGE